MSLPRFIDRVGDALVGAAMADRTALIARLSDIVVGVALGPRCADPLSDGGATAVLAGQIARLYPTLRVGGDPLAVAAFVDEVLKVNPVADVRQEDVDAGGSLFTLTVPGRPSIAVDTDGWNVLLDVDRSVAATPPASPLVCLVAVALGAAYLFRTAFADDLPHGRHAVEPATLNLVTLGTHDDTVLGLAPRLTIGDVHIAGAGAIGQATVLGLAAHARAHGLDGRVHVVDPEALTVSNLQRYALAHDTDEGVTKADLAVAHLRAAGVDAVGAEERWGDGPEGSPGRHTVLVALDSAADRLGVAGGSHRAVYNAYTGAADIGWSRHEPGNDEPCLACLYLPRGRRPDRHETVAAALGVDPIRVLGYLVTGTAVGLPLPALVQTAQIPAPPEAGAWLERSLINDLRVLGMVTSEQAAAWAGRDIETLYRDGVCGGAIVGMGDNTGGHVLVPLAHHSLLAGLMLALQPLLAADPSLAARRPHHIEARLDPLAALPQVLSRPRGRTEGCICGDRDYRPTAADA